MSNKNLSEIFMAGPSITEHEIEMVGKAMSEGWYGKKAYHYVETFENEFANYHDRKYGLMTPNCTTAIHLLLAGLDIKSGDEVIVPDCTWVGSVAGISYLGAKTVFADIDSKNWCLNANSIKDKITEKTKAVIAVDLYGNMPDYDSIVKLCDEYNLLLIEDAAEALGSTYKNIKAGKFGIGSTFSFHRTKTITTGEGGMLLLDDEDLYNRCKFLRDHGREPGTYFNTEVTFKYMPFNVQAALGYAQFQRLEELVNIKRWIWKSFKENLSVIDDIEFNIENNETYNGVWATALVFGKSHKINKEIALSEMPKKSMPVRPFFYPLSSLPAFDESRKYKDLNLNSYDISSRGINLPCSMNLTKYQIDEYSHELIKFIKEYK